MRSFVAMLQTVLLSQRRWALQAEVRRGERDDGAAFVIC